MALIQPTRHGQPFKPQVGRRLLLVDPYPRNNQYHLTASERRAVWFPKLSLPTIAAYTPESWDVDLVDEAVEDIDFDAPCDMVGLSIMPKEMAQLVASFQAGHIDEARRIHFALSALFAALFYETNPIPVKEALGMMGKIDPELRLPLCAMSADNRTQLTRVLKEMRLV